MQRPSKVAMSAAATLIGRSYRRLLARRLARRLEWQKLWERSEALAKLAAEAAAAAARVRGSRKGRGGATGPWGDELPIGLSRAELRELETLRASAALEQSSRAAGGGGAAPLRKASAAAAAEALTKLRQAERLRALVAEAAEVGACRPIGLSEDEAVALEDFIALLRRQLLAEEAEQAGV